LTGPQGPAGPQGVPGNDGAVGPQGPIGLTGPQGPQGVPGNDGAVGPQGPIGLTGPQGPIGLTGPQGPVGSDGAVGPQGPIGLTGPQGPIGLTGLQGPQGVPGPQGPIGLTGPQGPAGSDGAVGPQGPIGLTGPQGPAGSDGAVGPQGPIGLTGPAGPQGVPGNDGAVGPQGPIGLTGPQGPIGLTGPQGPIGLTGLQGPQGAQGATGNIGPVGPQGIPGTNGIGVTQTNVVGDSLFITLSNGQVLNAGHVRGTQGTIGGLQPGAQPGQLLYWNGTTWVSVPAGNHGQYLSYCNGVPVWGGCLPILSTSTAVDITSEFAKVGGIVLNDGGVAIVSRGVVYDTLPNPTTNNLSVGAGSGLGSFDCNLIRLNENKTYYVRAYATNSIGTGYGSQISFVTSTINSCPNNPTLTDVDGNTYFTVQISSLCWMRSNLKVTKYRTGQQLTSDYDYLFPDNNSQNLNIYGRLYRYDVAKNVNLCPTGWRLPTSSEVSQLITFLGGGSIGGGKLKSTSFWNLPNTGATNQTGFSGLPAAFRAQNTQQPPWFGYGPINEIGHWWVNNDGAPQADYFSLNFNNTIIQMFYYSQYPHVYEAKSVRCVKQ
jgi:uncharacterized protein (TIGR02145 family)